MMMKKLITLSTLALILMTASAPAQDRRYNSDPYRNDDGYQQNNDRNRGNNQGWNNGQGNDDYRCENSNYRYGRGFGHGKRNKVIVIRQMPRPVIIVRPDWDRRDCRHRHDECDYRRHDRCDRCDRHSSCHH